VSTAVQVAATPAVEPLPARKAPRRRVVRTRSGQTGLAISTVVTLAALFAPLIAPHAFDAVAFDHILSPPFWATGGSMQYPLGTDQLGRDTLSRLLYGARTSLVVGVGAVALAGAIGVTLGIVGGYAGGWIDDLIGRIADLQLAFPPIFLAITVMAVVGQTFLNLVLVLGVVSWVQYARVARSSTLTVKHLEYVGAAKALGAPVGRILWRHVTPNVLQPVLAIATVSVSTMIMAEAGLSFLGLGVPPPNPSWGGMLAESRDAWGVAPWNAILPGLAIFVAVLGINLLGSELAHDR
jgi:peptide/nickel transport system permease protein